MTEVAQTATSVDHPFAEGERVARRLLYGFALVFFATLALVSVLMSGPTYHQDEGSYLLNAAALAGRVQGGLVGGYYAGYSLLIAPAFMLLHDFGSIYHYTLLLNSALLATVPFALYRLLRHLLPTTEPSWWTLGAIAASCQVALVTDASMALSENALIPLYAWMLVAGASMLYEHRRTVAIACGVLGGCLFLVHPRGLTMAVPVLAALTLPAWREHRLRPLLAWAWTAASLVGALHWPLEWLAGKSDAPNPDTYSLTSVLGHFLHPEAYGWLAFNLVGAFTYLTVATFGVIVLSLRDTGSTVLSLAGRRLGNVNAQDAIRGAMLFGLAASMFVTAAYFNPPNRADQLIYGRYALPTLVPMVALGIVSLRSAMRGSPPRAWWSVAVTLACIVVMAIAFRILPHPEADTWVHVNIIDIYIPFVHAGRIDWPTIGFYFAVPAFVLYSASVWSARLGAIVFALINIGVAAIVTVHATLPANELRARERQAVIALRDFERSTGIPVCVSIRPEVDYWHTLDYRNWLYDRIDESTVVDRRRCVRGQIASLVTNRPSSDDYRLVSVDLNNPYGLFIQESIALSQYAVQHPLPPADFPTPLPDTEHTSNIQLNGISDGTRIPVGQSFAFKIRIAHGGQLTWPARFASSPIDAVRVGARVDAIGPDGDPHVESRTDLDGPLQPGESVILELVLEPFTNPGRYTVVTGVLQEGVAWMDETAPITVTVY